MVDENSSAGGDYRTPITTPTEQNSSDEYYDNDYLIKSSFHYTEENASRILDYFSTEHYYTEEDGTTTSEDYFDNYYYNEGSTGEYWTTTGDYDRIILFDYHTVFNYYLFFDYANVVNYTTDYVGSITKDYHDEFCRLSPRTISQTTRRDFSTTILNAVCWSRTTTTT